jgi:hypothetical protein
MTITYMYTLDLHYSLSRLNDPDADYANHPDHPDTHADDIAFTDITDGGGDYLTLTLSGYTKDRHSYALADSLGIDALTHTLDPCDDEEHTHGTDLPNRQRCAIRALLDEGMVALVGSHYFHPQESPAGYGHGDPVSATVAVHLRGTDDLT